MTMKKEIEGLILVNYQHRLRNSVFMQKKVAQSKNIDLICTPNKYLFGDI